MTEKNANAHGLTWQETGWPPILGNNDPFGFGAFFMAAMMLPLEGTHHGVTFRDGIPQSGVYRILLDAGETQQPSEARAMFIPPEAIAAMFR